MTTDQETAFTTRPSPVRPGSANKKGPRANGGSNGTPSRRLSLNSHQNGTRSSKEGKLRPAAPVNYVAISKDDASSHISTSETIPATP